MRDHSSTGSPWSEAPLGDVSEKIQDGTHFSPTSQSGPYRYVTSKNVRVGRLDLKDCGWISEIEHRGIYQRCDVRFGDILLTKDGVNTGNACINPLREELSLLSSVAFIRPDEVRLHARFALQYLLSPGAQARMQDLMSGNAIRRLTLKKIKSFTTPLPPLSEQRQIAAILDTLDDAIRKTEQIIAKLKQVKQGLLHDLLTRGIDDNGELRDPDRHPEQFKDSVLGRIPKGWEVKPLEACVHQQHPITYGIVQAGPHVPGGIPYIRTGDMSGERLVADGMLRTSARIAASYLRSRVEADEIVCAIRATVGKVLQVPRELDGANLTQGTARIAPGPDVNPGFLLWALRSSWVQRQFDLSVKGTTFREITLAQLRRLLVPLPTHSEEQVQVALLMRHAVDREASESAHRDKLLTVKAALMEDLLTGRVRVTSLVDCLPAELPT